MLPRRVASDCETCNDLNDGDIINSAMLCASVTDRGKAICVGNFGGPMIDPDGTQVRVVRQGCGCAWENLPPSTICRAESLDS
jgi:hypothetical protein